MKLENTLIPYTKINSKWFKDLNIRHDTIKLEENVGKIFSDISEQCFLRSFSQCKKYKAKISQWDLIKLKSFYRAKEIINKKKREYTHWEKIFANHVTDKSLISKIYKQFIQLNIKKIPNQKMDRRSKQIFLQRRHTSGQ